MTPSGRSRALETAIFSLANHKATHGDLTDEQVAQWVVATCLMFGATVGTAYQVAGLFVRGTSAFDAADKADRADGT